MAKQIDLSRSAVVKTWKNVREEVAEVNKEFAALVDAIAPDDSYKFLQVEYLYGDLTVVEGFAQIPDENDELSPINSKYVDKKIRQEFGYKNLPLFFILDKSNEVFIDNGLRAIPLNLYYKGNICGTYEMMDYMTGLPSDYRWHFSAGSRTTIMLPGITNNIGLRRVYADYHINSSLLINGMNDHWNLFGAIAQSKHFEQPWKNKVLYFGKKWFDSKNDSKSWVAFRNYLLKQAWQQAQYSINKVNFNLVWEKYAEAITRRRLKPEPYLLFQLKHILSLVRDDYPGLVPTDHSQEAMPTNGLKNAFINTYLLQQYYPTIMHARPHIYLKPDQPIYYSLSFPTLLEGSPLKKSSSTTRYDLRKMKILIETLQAYLSREGIEDKIVNKTEFDYFHTEKIDKHEEIRHCSAIFTEDSSFEKGELSPLSPNRKFCSNSLFLRGCIRMTPKKEQQKY
jgi:hypothetical protein